MANRQPKNYIRAPRMVGNDPQKWPIAEKKMSKTEVVVRGIIRITKRATKRMIPRKLRRTRIRTKACPDPSLVRACFDARQHKPLSTNPRMTLSAKPLLFGLYLSSEVGHESLTANTKDYTYPAKSDTNL